MAEVTITITDDSATGAVTVHTTFKPALGQRLSSAQALALDLATQAGHRAQVVHMTVPAAATTAMSALEPGA